jgi:polyisoprenoid-binding protein YceI
MDEFPTIEFVSTGARQTGDAEFELDGDLTVRGVTQAVRIPFVFEGTAVDPYGNTRVGFEGSVVINRKDFGVSYNAALETGGVLIGDKVTLEFEVSAVKTA